MEKKEEISEKSEAQKDENLPPLKNEKYVEGENNTKYFSSNEEKEIYRKEEESYQTPDESSRYFGDSLNILLDMKL
jgi:hypothetical protein